MKRWIILIFCFPAIAMLCTGIYGIITVQSYISYANSQMDDLVYSAYKYCTVEQQDISLFNKRIEKSGNYKVSSEYNNWLNAMEGYNSITIKDGVTKSVEGTGEEDKVFTDMIRHIESSGSSTYSRERTTPLNFGITYLNTSLLGEDVESYLKKILKLNLAILEDNVYSYTMLNPYNLDVTAEVTYTPLMLADSSSEVDYNFKKLFGLTKDEADPNSLIISDNKTIVKCTVKLFVDYEIVPQISFLRIRKKQISQFTGSKDMPKGTYFPHWYGDQSIKYKDGFRTIVLSQPKEYTFEYVIVN